MVPSTDCMLNLRAIQPSTLSHTEEQGCLERHGLTVQHNAGDANQICEAGIDEQRRCEHELVVEYRETEHRTGQDPRDGQKVGYRVDVLPCCFSEHYLRPWLVWFLGRVTAAILLYGGRPEGPRRPSHAVNAQD